MCSGAREKEVTEELNLSSSFQDATDISVSFGAISAFLYFS